MDELMEGECDSFLENAGKCTKLQQKPKEALMKSGGFIIIGPTVTN
jgi:hypothetical protein